MLPPQARRRSMPVPPPVGGADIFQILPLYKVLT
jgi:hypothetical protein